MGVHRRERAAGQKRAAARGAERAEHRPPEETRSDGYPEPTARAQPAAVPACGFPERARRARGVPARRVPSGLAAAPARAARAPALSEREPGVRPGVAPAGPQDARAVLRAAPPKVAPGRWGARSRVAARGPRPAAGRVGARREAAAAAPPALRHLVLRVRHGERRARPPGADPRQARPRDDDRRRRHLQDHLQHHLLDRDPARPGRTARPTLGSSRSRLEARPGPGAPAGSCSRKGVSAGRSASGSWASSVFSGRTAAGRACS